MRKLMLKIGFLAFIVFAAVVLLGERLDPLLKLFGEPGQIRTLITDLTPVIFFASLALVVARTLITIFFIILFAIAIFILLRLNLFGF